jgi:CBS domain containing-hemolysin-like protein
VNNPWIFLAVTTGLIGASAFFVAVEFALIAARRSRLEDAAPHRNAPQHYVVGARSAVVADLAPGVADVDVGVERQTHVR